MEAKDLTGYVDGSPVRKADEDTARIRIIQDTVRSFFVSLSLGATLPTPLLMAVSGGPDSLCMADAILTLAHELSLAPVIAHLDHQLRGEESLADAKFVRQFAVARNVHCIVEQVDVKALARERHLSIEVAARQLRYRFLASAARAIGARYIALAHNADDQVETVLLRLVRGTGVQGLQGMRPLSTWTVPSGDLSSVILLRPLLNTKRQDIEAYCRARSLSPRHDTTNDQWHPTRNRIRHELLPLLEHYNPGIRRVLLRLAETAASDWEIIDHATQQTFDSLLIDETMPSPDIQGQPAQPAFTLNRTDWRHLSIGLQRAVLREGVRRLKQTLTDVKYAGVEEARAVLNSDARSGDIAILQDVRIIVHAHSFTITLAPANL